MSRLTPNNLVVFDQADFFEGNGFTRLTGLVVGQLGSGLFFNNVLQPWPLVSGSLVTDALAVSAKVYWTEIPSAPGYYSVRFRPNGVGYWRLVLTYAAGTQTLIFDHDVIGASPSTDLVSSFFQV